MFDELFSRSDALERHRNGPLAEERHAFLVGQRHFSVSGNPKRKRAKELRRIPRLRVGFPCFGPHLVDRKRLKVDFTAKSGAVQLGNQWLNLLILLTNHKAAGVKVKQSK